MYDAFTIRTVYSRLDFSAGAITTITYYQGIDNLDGLMLLHDIDCETYASLFVSQAARLLVKTGYRFTLV